MGVFHVFKIVQMLPNRATHHIWNYFEGEEVPSINIFTHTSPFDLMPSTGLYRWTKLLKSTICDVEFSFRKIPGITLEAIEILVIIDMKEDFHLFNSWLNFVVMTINYLLNPFIAHKSNDYPNKTI